MSTGRRRAPSPSRRRLVATGFVFLVLSSWGLARGHDLWIEPSSFLLEPGETVVVSLRLGDSIGEPFPRSRSLIRRFEAVSPNGDGFAVEGIEGYDPAGAVRLDREGVWILAYESRPYFSDLEPEKFEDYLREEGLESILESRRERGESDQRGKELFSRSVKSLLQVGPDAQPSLSADRALGLPLELVAEPGDGKNDDELVLSVLFRRRPLTGALVELRPLAGGHAISERSDSRGQVRFTLADLAADSQVTEWLAAVVHMERATGDEAQRADWRSWFSTSSFVWQPTGPPSEAQSRAAATTRATWTATGASTLSER